MLSKSPLPSPGAQGNRDYKLSRENYGFIHLVLLCKVTSLLISILLERASISSIYRSELLYRLSKWAITSETKQFLKIKIKYQNKKYAEYRRIKRCYV